VKAEKISEVYSKQQKRHLPLALVVRKLEHAVSRFFLNFFVAALNLSPCFQCMLFTGLLLSDESWQQETPWRMFSRRFWNQSSHWEDQNPMSNPDPAHAWGLGHQDNFLCIHYLMFQIWVHCESIWIGKLTHVHIICPADEINLLFWQIIIKVSLAIERQHLSEWHSILWNADQDWEEDIKAKAM
jgi:hypothetical protein